MDFNKEEKVRENLFRKVATRCLLNIKENMILSQTNVKNRSEYLRRSLCQIELLKITVHKLQELVGEEAFPPDIIIRIENMDRKLKSLKKKT